MRKMRKKQGNRRSQHAESKNPYQAVFLQQQVRELIDKSSSADPEEKEVAYLNPA